MSSTMHQMWMTDSYKTGPQWASYMYASNVWGAAIIAMHNGNTWLGVHAAKDWPHTTLLIAEKW